MTKVYSEFYYIWSVEREMWWRNDKRGYSADFGEAGLYDFFVAKDIIKDANMDGHLHEIMIPFIVGENILANYKHGL